MSIKTARVNLWGDFIGALAIDDRTHFATFEYAPEWIQKGIEIAPIRMPLSTRKYSFPGLNPETYKGLPAVFADSLPDDFGNAVINAWLTRQGRSPESFTSIERLLYTANRGIGALEYAPALRSRGKNPLGNLELESLIHMAQNILNQRAGLIAGPQHDNNKAMETIFQLGTSAGGARAKAIVAINKKRTSIRSGQLTAPKGFEHYILKFDGVSEQSSSSELFGDPKGYGLMEYAYYRMALDIGIDVSPSELLREKNRAHFITKRFDRIGNKKIHFISLCGMDHSDFKKPGTYSYEELFSVARRLRLSRDEAIEIFRRMVFNVIARNQDDHSKNIGFLLNKDDGKWRLAPAFDMVYSYRKDSPWVNSHQMTINGKRDNLSREDLHIVATSCISNFSRKDTDNIINHVIDVVANWDHYAKESGVFPELHHKIKSHIRIRI